MGNKNVSFQHGNIPHAGKTFYYTVSQLRGGKVGNGSFAGSPQFPQTEG
jgi:hypothetical protein